MICAWTEFLSILPMWIRKSISQTEKSILELRLRVDHFPEVVPASSSVTFCRKISADDLNFCIHTASRYSPWTASSISQGYITGPGGHRIGICGTAYYQGGEVAGLRDLSSLCIRVARDVTGIADKLRNIEGSILIIGAPGWGKTTLLRDLIRQRSTAGRHICVTDERNELFPQGHFFPGPYTDILSGCSKKDGIEMLLRTMGPDSIAVDEITAPEDCAAVIHAAHCGVDLLATAHASSIEDFNKRKIYTPLIREGIFETIVILHRDRSWHMERGKRCCTNGSGQL